MELIRKADLGIEDIQTSEVPKTLPPSDFLDLLSEKTRSQVLADAESSEPNYFNAIKRTLPPHLDRHPRTSTTTTSAL